MSKEQNQDMEYVFNDKTIKALDYVGCWYKKAVDFIEHSNVKCAFVSTNSITQGEQVAMLWKRILNKIEIDFAYRTFRWDSEAYDKAAVHCVIIGFSLSGSLKNNRNAVGWASLPTNNANTHAVIASEQSERGNLPATENAPNNNNDKAVGWAFQPTTTPTGVDNTNIITDNANIDFAPNGAMVGKDAHPTTETTTAVGWASQPTNNAAGVDNADNFRQPEMGNIAPIEANGGLERSVTHPTTEQSMAENLSGNLKKQKIIYDGDKKIIAQNINPYLVDAENIIIERRTTPICNVSPITLGNVPKDDGNFFLTIEEKEKLMSKYPFADKYIRQFLGSREYINKIEKYVLWLYQANPAEIRQSSFIMDRIAAVKEFRINSNAPATRKMAEYPTDFWFISQPETDYLLIPRVSSERRRYIPIGFISPKVITNDSCSIVPNATLYEFGVLTSSVHMAWMRAVAGRLKSDYRYSGNIVYNNFIWCEPDTAQKAKIEQTAQAILDARANYPTSSLADLYDELTMPSDLRAAHKANDTAVLTAYGLPKTITEEEIVAFLMQEYQKRTSKN